MKTLLLWDIDGTLLTSGGAGIRALRPALRELFGVTAALDDIDYAGRTDRHIFRQIFVRHGIPIPRKTSSATSTATSPASPPNSTTPAPSSSPVCPLFSPPPRPAPTSPRPSSPATSVAPPAQTRPSRPLGFLSIRRLRRRQRTRTISTPALRRAREHTGVDFPPERVWVIGDTPHDIDCGRAIGARTLAVATGSHPSSILSRPPAHCRPSPTSATPPPSGA